MLLGIVERIVQILKKNPEYKIKANVPLRALFGVLTLRGMQVLRGLFRKPFCHFSGLILFVGKRVRIDFAHLLKLGNSNIIEDGVYISALSRHGIHFGNNVTIGKNSILQCTGVIANLGIGIQIGNNSAVGAQSYIGGQGGVEIGANVIMGPGVKIFSENHIFSHPDIPIRLQGETRLGVVIGDNCWVGANVTIVDGTHLGFGCVVAAGAVVNKSFPENSVIGGVPAKLIKNRLDNSQAV